MIQKLDHFLKTYKFFLLKFLDDSFKGEVNFYYIFYIISMKICICVGMITF